MARAEVKVEGFHLWLFAEPCEGKIIARVWDFGADQHVQVLEDVADDIDRAKLKCEAYVKGRIKEPPHITWTAPFSNTSSII